MKVWLKRLLAVALISALSATGYFTASGIALISGALDLAVPHAEAAEIMQRTCEFPESNKRIVGGLQPPCTLFRGHSCSKACHLALGGTRFADAS